MIINLQKEDFDRLSVTELEIIKFINMNEKRVIELSIIDIAEETFSSPSTVSRAIRKCGLNGFNELRHRLTTVVEDKEINKLGEIMNKSVIEAQILVERISVEQLLNIAKAILNAKKIYVLARGPSEFVGEEFCFKLQLLDINAMFISDPNIMKKKTEVLKDGELTFIFSLNGNTNELIEAAKNATLKNGTVISCCCNEHSSLNELSDHYIIGYRHKHISIKEYEVSSRVSLYMISRMITDYLVSYKNDEFENK